MYIKTAMIRQRDSCLKNINLEILLKIFIKTENYLH